MYIIKLEAGCNATKKSHTVIYFSLKSKVY